MRFEETQFPAEAERQLIRDGAKPLGAFVCRDSRNVVFVLLSDDPSGPEGAFEKHASVSASTNGTRRWPLRAELFQAAIAVGKNLDSGEVHRGKGGVVRS